MQHQADLTVCSWQTGSFKSWNYSIVSQCCTYLGLNISGSRSNVKKSVFVLS